MVDATSHQIGQALYHLLKSGGSAESIVEELPILERTTDVKRIIRQNPDGSIEIAEHIVTDERAY